MKVSIKWNALDYTGPQPKVCNCLSCSPFLCFFLVLHQEKACLACPGIDMCRSFAHTHTHTLNDTYFGSTQLTDYFSSSQAEARAEFAERSVQKLQKEVDRLEGIIIFRFPMVKVFFLFFLFKFFKKSFDFVPLSEHKIFFFFISKQKLNIHHACLASSPAWIACSF